MDSADSISSEQLKRVLQISRLLTVTADLDVLLLQIAEAACEMLGCDRASIFLYDAKADQLWTRIALQSREIRVPSGAGIVGHVFKSNSVLHVAKPYEDARFNPEPDRKSGFVTRNLLTAPMPDLDGKPVGVIQAVNKKSGSFASVDETMIRLLADQAGVAIQRYNLQCAAIQAVELRREMDLAKVVQQALLPGAVPRMPGIEAAGWAKAASITGGDCYDLWLTGDGRLGIFLGDATGHGIGPAMVVSQTRTLIRALCEMRPDPRDLLACANARLAEDLDAGSFVTAFVGFISSDGSLEWCSAGHGPILLRMDSDSGFEMFDASAPPLGVLPDFAADPVLSRKLGPGGLICISSDGIPEAFAPSGEQFSAERLTEILAAEKTDHPQDMIARVQAAVLQWQGIDEPKDDQTLVIAMRK